jgi:hypothetical protein
MKIAINADKASKSSNGIRTELNGHEPERHSIRITEMEMAKPIEAGENEAREK